MSYTGQTPDTEPAGQWIKQAACHAEGMDPDAMFPENNEHAIAEAKAICRPCPVQVDCVLDALRTGDNEYGIRGGLKPAERRELARQLAHRRQGTVKGLPDTIEEPARPKPRPKRTFQTLWAERAVELHGGHLGWTGSVPVPVGGIAYTPRQIAFRVDRNRPPVGPVRRTCDVDGCVLPAHLMDQQERQARDRADAQVEVAA